MTATRTATVTWNGTLQEGSGTVSAGSSGLFMDLPVSWASRTESPDGRTSPEELLAAAHASCFAMALSGAPGARRRAARITCTCRRRSRSTRSATPGR